MPLLPVPSAAPANEAPSPVPSSWPRSKLSLAPPSSTPSSPPGSPPSTVPPSSTPSLPLRSPPSTVPPSSILYLPPRSPPSTVPPSSILSLPPRSLPSTAPPFSMPSLPPCSPPPSPASPNWVGSGTKHVGSERTAVKDIIATGTGIPVHEETKSVTPIRKPRSVRLRTKKAKLWMFGDMSSVGEEGVSGSLLVGGLRRSGRLVKKVHFTCTLNDDSSDTPTEKVGDSRLDEAGMSGSLVVGGLRRSGRLVKQVRFSSKDSNDDNGDAPTEKVEEAKSVTPIRKPRSVRLRTKKAKLWMFGDMSSGDTRLDEAGMSGSLVVGGLRSSRRLVRQVRFSCKDSNDDNGDAPTEKVEEAESVTPIRKPRSVRLRRKKAKLWMFRDMSSGDTRLDEAGMSGSLVVGGLRRSGRLVKQVHFSKDSNDDNGDAPTEKVAAVGNLVIGGLRCPETLSRLHIKPEDSARVKKNITDTQGEKSGDVFIIYDKRTMDHIPVSREKPARIARIIKKLEKDGLLERCKVSTQAYSCDLPHVLAVHTETYIEFLQGLPLSINGPEASEFVETDIEANDGTKNAIFLAAGAVIEACNQVATGQCQSGFAIVRPPGHHAKSAKANGFCFINNVAVGARYLQKHHNMRKILIVDFDVHHGDGTQEIFFEDDTILFLSVHGHGIFPEDSAKTAGYTGRNEGTGYNINVSLENVIHDDCLLAVWDHILLPAAKQFNPDFIMISAGFDAALKDPLGGGAAVTPHCFGQLVSKLMEINPKMILVLEGGYNLGAISECASACVRALLGDKAEVQEEYTPWQSTWNTINSVRNQHKDFVQVFAREIDEEVLDRYKHG